MRRRDLISGWILAAGAAGIGLSASVAAAAERGWVCDADVNIDAKVDVLDLLAVLGDWGTSGGGLGSGGPGTDVNGDGTVDVLDLLLVLKGWGEDCSPPAVSITPVAHVGDPVPGLDDISYAYLIGPLIDDAGNVLFRTFLAGDSIDSTNYVAYLYGPPSGLEVIAWMGQPAPDMGGQVLLKSLDGFKPYISETGWITFMSELSGEGIIEDYNDMAAFAGPPDDLRVVLQGGDQAPGLDEGIIIDVDSWTWFGGLPSDDGTIMFVGTLTGPGVDESNDLAAWLGPRDDLELVYREGMDAPGTEPGVTFWAASMAVYNNASYAFLGILTGDGIDETNKHGRWIGPPGGLELVAREGDPAAGFPEGVIYTTVANLVATNNHGETNVWAQIAGPGITEDDHRVIYAGSPNDLVLVSQTGDPAPEAGPEVEVAKLGNSLINDQREILYKVTYRGASIDDLNKWAIYFGPYESPRLELRDGEHAPFFPLNTKLFYMGGVMSIAAMNDIGDIVAPSEITGPGVPDDADVILWMRHRELERWVPLLGSGTVIDGRTVYAAEPGDIGDGYANKTGGSDGYSQSLNDNRQLAVKLEFTDGTHGIYLIELAEHHWRRR